MFQLVDYQYNLPEDRIAQQLAKPADHSKLLLCKQYHDQEEKKYALQDAHFFDIATLMTRFLHRCWI